MRPFAAVPIVARSLIVRHWNSMQLFFCLIGIFTFFLATLVTCLSILIPTASRLWVWVMGGTDSMGFDAEIPPACLRLPPGAAWRNVTDRRITLSDNIASELVDRDHHDLILADSKFVKL